MIKIPHNYTKLTYLDSNGLTIVISSLPTAPSHWKWDNGFSEKISFYHTVQIVNNYYADCEPKVESCKHHLKIM